MMKPFQPLSIDTSTINVAETAGYAEIGLTLSSSSTETVSISYSTAGVTATDGIDYTNQSSTTTEISSGTVGKIYIPITDDNVFEGIERFEVSITQITGAAYSTGVLNTPITVTITDNETQPTISISAYTCEESETIPTNMSINESIGNLIFNAKLSHPSQTPVTFNYSATVSTQSSINAASSADFYVTSSKEYTIYPGSVCTEVVTPITHDEIYEEDEEFEVSFTSSAGSAIIPNFNVTIQDDDVISWSIDDLAMAEGDSNTGMFFDVSVDNMADESILVEWGIATKPGDTATFREDYSPRHNSHYGQAVLLTGETSHRIGHNNPNQRIETTGDTIYEPDETFTVTLTNPWDGTEIADGVAIGTILNDDPIPTLIVSNIARVNEADGNVEIPVNLSNRTTEVVTLRYSTTNGTATSGTDFIAQTNQTLTIPALASAGTIQIPIIDDNVYEGLETFTVTLSDTNNANFPFLEETYVVNVSISESKSKPEISFANPTPTVNESSRTATITVNLNYPSTEAISVKYETSGVTADSTGSNLDFISLTNQPLNFAAGETSKDISITINQDTLNEGNESFTVTLRQAINATFPNSASILIATVTIVDDDSPTLSFKTTNFTVNESNTTLNVEVELSAPTTNTVSFDAVLGGGTASRFSDYEPLTNPQSSITTGTIATIPIVILSDGQTQNNEGNETFDLTISNLTGAIFTGEVESLTRTITILDNTMPSVSFLTRRVTVSENISGGMVNIEIALNGPTTNDVTVRYATSSTGGVGEATSNVDFTAPTQGSNNATILANQLTGLIQIPIINDNLDEPS